MIFGKGLFKFDFAYSLVCTHTHTSDYIYVNHFALLCTILGVPQFSPTKDQRRGEITLPEWKEELRPEMIVIDCSSLWPQSQKNGP